MKVLIACEESGTVRDAFTKKGHDAISCDLQPSRTPGKHYQGNVFDIINDGFDLMIGFPPCTFLTNAGIRWFNEERYGENAVQRKLKRLEAMKFFLALYNAPIPKVCLENPVGYPNSVFRKPDQIIQPYYFGDSHKKPTCLWMRCLPLLVHSKEDDMFYKKTHIAEPEPLTIQYRKPSKYYKGGEVKKRYFTDASRDGKTRSVTFQGIANAMAEQWG